MPDKKKPVQKKALLSKSPMFRTLYVTGATGLFTPFDYRLVFYNHESQFPEKPEILEGVPVSQVFQVEIVMSYDLVKNLKAMLERQIRKRETPPPKTEGEAIVKSSGSNTQGKH